jgi:hypothetical protein
MSALCRHVEWRKSDLALTINVKARGNQPLREGRFPIPGHKKEGRASILQRKIGVLQ